MTAASSLNYIPEGEPLCLPLLPQPKPILPYYTIENLQML